MLYNSTIIKTARLRSVQKMPQTTRQPLIYKAISEICNSCPLFQRCVLVQSDLVPLFDSFIFSTQADAWLSWRRCQVKLCGCLILCCWTRTLKGLTPPPAHAASTVESVPAYQQGSSGSKVDDTLNWWLLLFLSCFLD